MVGKSRGAGRMIEFIHTFEKTITKEFDAIVITIDPERIQKDLKNYCEIDVEFKVVYEGVKGLSLEDIRKREGYPRKIVGYKFRKL